MLAQVWISKKGVTITQMNKNKRKQINLSNMKDNFQLQVNQIMCIRVHVAMLLNHAQFSEKLQTIQ